MKKQHKKRTIKFQIAFSQFEQSLRNVKFALLFPPVSTAEGTEPLFPEPAAVELSNCYQYVQHLASPGSIPG